MAIETEETNAFYINFCISGSVQSLSHVRLFAAPWTAAHQGSLSITNSWSLLKLMSPLAIQEKARAAMKTQRSQ